MSIAFLLALTALDLVTLKTPVHARLSPDGSQIAAVIVEPDAKRVDLEQAIWLVPPEGPPRRIIAGGGNPRWSPDGKTLAFLSLRERGRQLWISTPSGQSMQRLTDLAGGVDDYAWSPDGAQLALIGGAGQTSGPQVHLLDRRSGSLRQLTSMQERVVVAPWDPDANLSFSPDGKSIAFAAKPSARFDDDYRSDLYKVEIAGSAITRLTDRPGMDLRPVFSPDGRWIAFRTSFGKIDRYANHGLAIVSADGKEVRDIGRAMELGFLDGPYWYDWRADSRTIVFNAAQKAAIHIAALDIGSGAIRPLTSGEAVHVRPSLSRDRSHLSTIRSDPATPWEVWSMPHGGELRQRTILNPQVRQWPAVRYERVHWKASDGMEIEGILTRPPGREGAGPLVVYLHGGPEGMIFHGFTPEVPLPGIELHATPPQWYAAQGWSVFYPNFRGSGGYGERLRRAAMKDWSGGFADDVMRGIDALVARSLADPKQLFLTGSWRSGSTKVISLLTQTNRFRAAAALSPYPDVEALSRARDDFHLQHHALFGGSPDANPESWKRHDPIHHVGKISTPLLLIHDERDFAIRSEQSQKVHRLLLEQRVPGRLLLLRSRNLRDDASIIESISAWFAQHMD